MRMYVLVMFWLAVLCFMAHLGLMSMDHPRSREAVTLGGELARALANFAYAVLLAWLLWAS